MAIMQLNITVSKAMSCLLMHGPAFLGILKFTILFHLYIRKPLERKRMFPILRMKAIMMADHHRNAMEGGAPRAGLGAGRWLRCRAGSRERGRQWRHGKTLRGDL